MEATGEDLTLLHQIRPPNLENAGLEDCALPPDAIKEAFFKAASAVSSRAASIFAGDDEFDGGCVSDPWIEKSAPEDALVGIEPEGTPPGPCAAGKGGALGGNGDTVSDVVVVGDGSGCVDDVVVVGGGQGGEGDGCVDGLRGLEIKDKEEERDKDDEEDEKKKPTLVEGFF